MKYLDAFRFLSSRRKGQIVITSAANSCQAWWEVTRDSEGTFYLDASMSLSTLFGSGLALAQPKLKIWAFMGDGAFCMNPGTLMVERQLDLPNLTHFLISNRAYGGTANTPLPNRTHNDYTTIARGMGLKRVFAFDTLEALEKGFDEVENAKTPGHTFVVLEVEPFTDAEQKLEQPPFDGPELKYRFGRFIEKQTGCNIFGYRF
jgi:thiamine pyrophosphate-dependent acetolactate synthase large subunit-like protein